MWTANKAPEQSTEEGKSLAAWVEDELDRFQTEQLENLLAVDLRQTYNEPLRPQTGMIVYADGVKWNPGEGEGAYTRNSLGLWIPLSNSRKRLQANGALYVRADGSDFNSGTADTAAGAFLTIQKAIDVVAGAYDLGPYGMTIFVRNGTYARITLKSYVGAGPVRIEGDVAAPSNVVIQSNAAFAITHQGTRGRYQIAGVRIAATGSIGLYVSDNAAIDVDRVDFGVSLYHIYAERNGIVVHNGAFSVSGAANYLWSILDGGRVECVSRTITLVGVPAIAFFASAIRQAGIVAPGCTFVGTFTGQRYAVASGGVITVGGALGYFPGTIAGTGTDFSVAPWGLYQ